MAILFYILIGLLSIFAIGIYNGSSKITRAYIGVWGILSASTSIYLIKSNLLLGETLLHALVVGFGIIGAVHFCGMVILFLLEYKDYRKQYL